MKEPFKIYKFFTNKRNKTKSFMMPILCSTNENWVLETRKIYFDSVLCQVKLEIPMFEQCKVIGFISKFELL
jgi:hypothetical protein